MFTEISRDLNHSLDSNLTSGLYSSCVINRNYGDRMIRSTASWVLLAGTFLLVAACSDSDSGERPTSPTVTANVEITAENLQFDLEEFASPANTRVTVTFNNLDAGVLHNLAIYTDESADVPIFIGEPFMGIETRDYSFMTPEPGQYFFRCNVHPDTMKGTFIVS